MARKVAGPHSPGFLPMSKFEIKRIQESVTHNT